MQPSESCRGGCSPRTVNESPGSETHSHATTPRSNCRRSPVGRMSHITRRSTRVLVRFGYEFLYWFKRAFGARLRCGRR
jgi:hypothetical protein